MSVSRRSRHVTHLVPFRYSMNLTSYSSYSRLWCRSGTIEQSNRSDNTPFDTFTHTLLCLHHADNLTNDYRVKLAVLYHDVGKTQQYYAYTVSPTIEDKRNLMSTWLNHVTSWPEIAANDLRMLTIPTKYIDQIKWYIAQHMKAGEILMAKEENRTKKGT